MSRFIVALFAALAYSVIATGAASAAGPLGPVPCVSTDVVEVGCPGDGTPGDGTADDGTDDGTADEPACRDADLVPTSRNAARIRRATLCLVNDERKVRNRKPLKAQRHLTRAATRYARTMVKRKFFGHVSPKGSTLSTRVRSSGYLSGSLRRWSAGENIAWGSGLRATPTEIVNGWMHSAGHRRNILDTGFTEAGFGVRTGTPVERLRGAAATYVNVFGSRKRR